jgi:hypothetical protein
LAKPFKGEVAGSASGNPRSAAGQRYGHHVGLGPLKRLPSNEQFSQSLMGSDSNQVLGIGFVE